MWNPEQKVPLVDGQLQIDAPAAPVRRAGEGLHGLTLTPPGDRLDGLSGTIRGWLGPQALRLRRSSLHRQRRSAADCPRQNKTGGPNPVEVEPGGTQQPQAAIAIDDPGHATTGHDHGRGVGRTNQD